MLGETQEHTGGADSLIKRPLESLLISCCPQSLKLGLPTMPTVTLTGAQAHTHERERGREGESQQASSPPLSAGANLRSHRNVQVCVCACVCVCVYVCVYARDLQISIVHGLYEETMQDLDIYWHICACTCTHRISSAYPKLPGIVFLEPLIQEKHPDSVA